MLNEATASDDTMTTKESPKDAVISVARHAARIQIAAVTTIGKLAATWAHAADHYAQAVADELLRRVEGETASTELVVRLAAATSSHFRDVTALPNVAVTHFSSELARTATSRRR